MSEGGLMKLYELTVIFDSSLDDSSIQTEIDKIQKIIADDKGKVVKVDRWGVRRLAYLIDNHHQGNYVFFLYESNPGLSSQIERGLKINDNVLRYLTVVSEAGIPEEKPEPVVEKAVEDDIPEIEE
jgi:small subunit ribosomal protein S6